MLHVGIMTASMCLSIYVIVRLSTHPKCSTLRTTSQRRRNVTCRYNDCQYVSVHLCDCPSVHSSKMLNSKDHFAEEEKCYM